MSLNFKIQSYSKLCKYYNDRQSQSVLEFFMAVIKWKLCKFYLLSKGKNYEVTDFHEKQYQQLILQKTTIIAYSASVSKDPFFLPCKNNYNAVCSSAYYTVYLEKQTIKLRVKLDQPLFYTFQHKYLKNRFLHFCIVKHSRKCT